MTDKRFSELPDAQALSDTDILAVSQMVDGVLESRKITVAALKAMLAPQTTVVKSGDVVNVLTAEPGTYYFLPGSTISGVSGFIFTMSNVVLQVYEKGRCAKVSFLGRLNNPEVDSSSLCAAEYLLWPRDGEGLAPYWRWLGGYGDLHTPQANGSFTVMTPDEAGVTSRTREEDRP